MALMKMLRGGEESLKNQPLHDGYIWWCYDSGKMYIDAPNSDSVITRYCISADFADSLRYISDGETIELTPQEINAALNSIDDINNIDYDTYLAFDTTKIV